MTILQSCLIEFELRSEGGLNHLMSELTPKPNSTGGEKKKKEFEL
jgi:hypothetical protein